MRTYLGDARGRGGDDLNAIGQEMRLYLGAPTKNDQDVRDVGRTMFERQPLRMLFSYHYYRDHNLDELFNKNFDGIKLDLFADSGAFSAFTQGQTIDVASYIEWVRKWKHWFTVVAGPDVIGDAVATTTGTERMIAELPGVTVLPTFHVGEDWSYLTRWVGKVDYLAFGGMVPHSRDRTVLEAWVAKAFSHLPPEMRVHGFGMTNWDLMRVFPWYSVDSSSWTGAFRFGTLVLFDGGRWVSLDLHKPREALKHSRMLASYGLRPTDIKGKGYDRDRLVGACVMAWRRAEAWLSNRDVSRSPKSYFVTTPVPKAPNAPETIARAARKLEQ